MNCLARTLRRPRTVRLAALSAAMPVLALSGVSHAWLGSFEAADGYRDFLHYVQDYNAGAYGPNGGYGGSYTPIAPNSGLWQALSGGVFSGGATSYATGHFARDRQWVNSGIGSSNNLGLMLTTNHLGWGGPALKYNYNLDAADMGGTTPGSSSILGVKMSFWTQAQLPGFGGGGQVPEGYFGDEVAFVDSGGNVGIQVGITQRAGGDRVTYWNGTSLIESTVTVDGFYDRWDVDINLAAGTFSLDYFDFSANTLHNFVSGASLGAMANFTDLTFRSSPGENNAKFWSVDDFSFETRLVPAPAALALLAPGALVITRRRRTR